MFWLFEQDLLVMNHKLSTIPHNPYWFPWWALLCDLCENCENRQETHCVGCKSKLTQAILLTITLRKTIEQFHPRCLEYDSCTLYSVDTNEQCLRTFLLKRLNLLERSQWAANHMHQISFPPYSHGLANCQHWNGSQCSAMGRLAMKRIPQTCAGMYLQDANDEWCNVKNGRSPELSLFWSSKTTKFITIATNYAVRKFSNTAEFPNERRMVVSAIVHRDPIIRTMFWAWANLTYRTHHNILASVEQNISNFLISLKIDQNGMAIVLMALHKAYRCPSTEKCSFCR